jgi:hypothetical protein
VNARTRELASAQNTSRLTSELAAVTAIMRRNITEVLDRGDKLEGETPVRVRVHSPTIGTAMCPLRLVQPCPARRASWQRTAKSSGGPPSG